MAESRVDKIKFWYIVFHIRTDLTVATSMAPSGSDAHHATAPVEQQKLEQSTMRKIMLSAAAAAVVLSGPVAFAATAAAKSETGVIAQIDTKAPSITLKSGKIKTFFLGKEIALADF